MHENEVSGHGKGMIFQISFLYPEFDLHGLTAIGPPIENLNTLRCTLVTHFYVMIVKLYPQVLTSW